MHNNSGLVIGIDIGTGSTKAVSIDNTGSILASCQNHYPADLTTEIQDPQIIVNSFISCLKEILFKTDKPVGTICLSSCMHSLMLVDENDTPLTDIITWSDSRASSVAANLRSEYGYVLYCETGTPIHAMTPLCKICWFKDNQPDLFHRTKKFIGIKEFIWHQLFHSYEIDYSIASATGLFNTQSLNWNPLSLQLAEITEDQLSKIVPGGHSLKCNNQNPEYAFLNGINFMIGSSDGCLANIGSGVISNDTAAITIGTSGAVRTTSTHPVNDYKNMLFNYVLEKDTIITGGPINNGGNTLKWLLNTYLQISDPSEKQYLQLFEMVEQVPAGSNGLIFLPYLHGERAPIWDELSTGAFIGINARHTTAHFLRAGLEGVCFALSNILNILAQIQIINKINVSGGFINSPVWTQILSDITGKEISIIHNEDSSALGAAFFALKANGIINNYDEIVRTPIKNYKPQSSNNKLYNQYFDIYLKLYSTLQPITSALNLANVNSMNKKL